MGFVQWRVAFYCAGTGGCIENLMQLLDDFFVWKTKAVGKDIEIRVHPHLSVLEITEDFVDGLEYDHYVYVQPEMNLPLGVFEAQPVVGKRVCTLEEITYITKMIVRLNDK